MANDHMPNICKISMSLVDPIPEQFAINYTGGLPSYFNIVYKVCIANVRTKYDIVTNMLSAYACYPSNGFYNLAATDSKIYNIFNLIHTSADIYCSCEQRVFQVGIVDGFRNYSHFGVFRGMRTKTVAYEILNQSTEKLRKIILGENTPDQGVRYYSYTVVGGERLILNHDVKVKVKHESKSDDDDSETHQSSNSDDIDEEADPVLETACTSGAVQPPSDVKTKTNRGDDPGDVTNCLNHGDIINHAISSDIWLAKYDAVSNTLKPIPIDIDTSYSKSQSLAWPASVYSRGGESCPIQDFVVAHLKTRGLPHNDNSWTNCSVWNTNTNMFYPIRNLVRDYFGVDN
jgi:hypothetical protein